MVSRALVQTEIAAKPVAHAWIPATSVQPLSEIDHVTNTSPVYIA